MEDQYQDAFQQLLARGATLRDIIENSIEFTAQMAVQDHAADGIMLDPEDAYDTILEGIRSSAERRLASAVGQPFLDRTRSE